MIKGRWPAGDAGNSILGRGNSSGRGGTKKAKGRRERDEFRERGQSCRVWLLVL